jgi:hypothetical protein
MGEGNDTIHGRCRIADKKKPIKTGEFHSMEFWMVLFNGAFDTKGSSYNEPSSPKLKQFAIRLCKTNPKLIFDTHTWEGNTIKSRQDTIVWVAARKFFGDVWTGFDIAKEVVAMEVDDKDEPMVINESAKKTTPIRVTPSKGVNWTIVPNKQMDKEKGSTEKDKQKETGVKTVVNKFF